MRAIGYVRVSTDEQATDGVSLDAQRARITSYCSLYDIELVDVVVDAGLSAKNLNRPGLQRALTMLKRGEVDAIIVAKLDRLTRRTRDLLDLVETTFKSGERVLLSVHEKIDTSSAAGRMILTVLGALAEFERAQLGERTSAAMAHMAERGLYTGGRAPFGYHVGDAGELVENPAEQEVIAEVRALRAGGLSLRAIVATLNERGRRSRVGKPFALTQITNMLAEAS